MRIAVLVLAHKNPDQLGRLVSRLAANFDVFVHLDKNSAVPDSVIAAIPRVTVLRRHRIHWGSPSIIDATVTLIRTAAAGGYDRYVLISGQDLPVQSNAAITAFYAAHPDVDFVTTIQDPEWCEIAMSRVTRFHVPDPYATSGLRSRALRRLEREVHRVTEKRGLAPRPDDWDFRFGPNWCDLTGDTVKALLRFLDLTPEFRRRFRWTRSADEAFMQTALVACGREHLPTEPVPRYIDWSTRGNHPKTLVLADLPQMLDSGALFARKFDEAVDPDVIDVLLSR